MTIPEAGVTDGFPQPPYRLRSHKDAPRFESKYRLAAEQIELAGWFHQALRELVGAAAAIEADGRAAADLAIERIHAAGEDFHVIQVEGLVVYFWLSASSRTIHILHCVSIGFFRAHSKSGSIIAAGRLASIRAADARRTSTLNQEPAPGESS